MLEAPAAWADTPGVCRLPPRKFFEGRRSARPDGGALTERRRKAIRPAPFIG